MKLPNNVYDVLKWVVMIALPAIAFFIGQVGGDIGIQNVDTVVKVLNALATLMGALIGVSSYTHNKGE